MDDVARTRELVRVAGALEDAGCQPIVFKGAALAHTHYRQPWLRPRLDIDVLVAERGREPASRALRGLGYERLPFVSGRLVMYQEPLVRAEAGGLEHVVDLHWRVANPQAVSRVLSHRRCRCDRSRSPCRAGVSACRVRPTRSSWPACTGRRITRTRRICCGCSTSTCWRAAWRTPNGARLSAPRAAGTVTALCARGLALAAERFGTTVPAFVTAAFDHAASRRAVGGVPARAA